MLRVISIIHTSPGRTRLRLPWLRQDAKQATSLADALLRVAGIHEVQVRPFTGSVLCIHDPQDLDLAGLLEEVRRHTGVEAVARPGEEPPDEDELLRSLSEGSSVARAASQLFKGINVDVLRATEGRMDLGALATLGFAAAGAVEVAVTGRLSPPPWFSLGWWAFRTFVTLERVAIQNTVPPVRHNGGAAPAAHGPGTPGTTGSKA
ncbi:HMA2 domain-containing protein [Corallococcus sp. RDP092CA]|uniref:HMA2 domain-containing protein n=1 Tax=Corallococcus sp. RDP092CA TaxID=3109369 RepID=UPI0035B0FA7E